MELLALLGSYSYQRYAPNVDISQSNYFNDVDVRHFNRNQPNRQVKFITEGVSTEQLQALERYRRTNPENPGDKWWVSETYEDSDHTRARPYPSQPPHLVGNYRY